jgi:hypothetical protein
MSHEVLWFKIGTMLARGELESPVANAGDAKRGVSIRGSSMTTLPPLLEDTTGTKVVQCGFEKARVSLGNLVEKSDPDCRMRASKMS